jgi:hypothetical protein
MILFPTTLLFRVTNTQEWALDDLTAGRPDSPEAWVDLDHDQEIVRLASARRSRSGSTPTSE